MSTIGTPVDKFVKQGRMDAARQEVEKVIRTLNTAIDKAEEAGLTVRLHQTGNHCTTQIFITNPDEQE